MPTETNELLAEVTQLPVQPGAAMRLLWMLEDPRTSASDLGRLIESDPALSAQVIRLANTAFYGLSGKVSSAWRAVTVLGLSTVRAIATTAAFDLFSGSGRPVPEHFWPHSLTSAAAAAALARRVGVQPNDAFSAGLLHDIGAALMFRRAPERADAVMTRIAADPDADALDLERREMGTDHAEVGSAVLTLMRFPTEMVEAIALHHAALDELPTQLARVVAAADALSMTIVDDPSERGVPLADALALLDIPASAAETLQAEVARDQENLTGFLTV